VTPQRGHSEAERPALDEKLREFMEMTQLEMHQAKPLLEKAGWDVQAAVDMHFNVGCQPPVKGQISFRTALAIAQSESEEARKRCFICGARTDYPKRIPDPDCPLLCCHRHVEELNCKWLNLKKEFHEMDTQFP